MSRFKKKKPGYFVWLSPYENQQGPQSESRKRAVEDAA